MIVANIAGTIAIIIVSFLRRAPPWVPTSDVLFTWCCYCCCHRHRPGRTCSTQQYKMRYNAQAMQCHTWWYGKTVDDLSDVDSNPNGICLATMTERVGKCGQYFRLPIFLIVLLRSHVSTQSPLFSRGVSLSFRSVCQPLLWQSLLNCSRLFPHFFLLFYFCFTYYL